MADKLTSAMVQYIQHCCNTVEYGKVIITLNKTSNTIDISVEQKRKFDKVIR